MSGNTKIKCRANGCTKEYLRKSDMEDHHFTVHMNGEFPCTQNNCSKSYKTRKGLRLHMKKHPTTTEIPNPLPNSGQRQNTRQKQQATILKKIPTKTVKSTEKAAKKSSKIVGQTNTDKDAAKQKTIKSVKVPKILKKNEDVNKKIVEKKPIANAANTQKKPNKKVEPKIVVKGVHSFNLRPRNKK